MKGLPATGNFLFTGILAGVILVAILASPIRAQEFRIGIMADAGDPAGKYAPLEAYLSRFGLQAGLIGTSSYPEAARMFVEGKVDAMFCGSGVAGILIQKDLGFPLLRPVRKDGKSTCGAVILAPKGAPEFNPGGDYFQGKKVAFCALASAGEFFFRSVPGAEEASVGTIKAGSHNQAVWILSEGMADTAIVKDRVWADLENRYPHLIQVGKAAGKNPDGTLIVSRKAEKAAVGMMAWALVALEKDQSPDATAVRDSLGIERFALTSRADFNHTFDLLEKAGVGPNFNFPAE